MYVDAHRCSRWMSMLSNVLDVCWCSPMSWMYVNVHHQPDVNWCQPLTSWFITPNFYYQCTPMSLDFYLLICFEKKSQFLLQDTPKLEHIFFLVSLYLFALDVKFMYEYLSCTLGWAFVWCGWRIFLILQCVFWPYVKIMNFDKETHDAAGNRLDKNCHFSTLSCSWPCH